MVGAYQIFRGVEPVGTVQVEKQGLYYQFSCRCTLRGATMQRIMVACGERKVDLGICVPMGDVFGIDRRVPCKQLGEGKPEFFLIPRVGRAGGKFVPVYPEEPFAYMAKLKDAYLEVRCGQAGIVLAE